MLKAATPLVIATAHTSVLHNNRRTPGSDAKSGRLFSSSCGYAALHAPAAGAGCTSQHHPAHPAPPGAGSAGGRTGHQVERRFVHSVERSSTDLARMCMISEAGVQTLQPSRRARAKSSRETASTTLALDGTRRQFTMMPACHSSPGLCHIMPYPLVNAA